MSLQVPGSWRSLIEDPATIKLFLEFYRSTEPPLSNQALECLVGSTSSQLVCPDSSLQNAANNMMISDMHSCIVYQGLGMHSWSLNGGSKLS